MPTVPEPVGAGGGGGAPAGVAGGDLGGTYPNPAVATVGGTAAATIAANIPTANQKAALAGTGTPSGSDKYVSDSDARNTNSRAPNGSAGGDLGGTYPSPSVATVGGSAAATVAGQRAAHEGAYDHTLLPTANQKAALAGTGTPSGTDKFVSNSDSRMTDARTPSAHHASHQNGGSDEIATATPGANAIPKATAGGKLTSWIDAATNAIAGLLSAAHYAILAAFSYGTKSVDLDIEGGTYNGSVTTSSLGGAKSRSWDGNADGSGRYQCDPLPGRTGGDVVFRLKVAISASGSAGKKLVWKLSAQAFDTGDTLPASVLGNAQTNNQDIAAVTAKVITDFDITVLASVFDQNKSMMNFVLERLASTDANDNYANADGAVHLLAIKLIYTGFGGIAAPSAPP